MYIEEGGVLDLHEEKKIISGIKYILSPIF